GTTAGSRNVISGNAAEGVRIFASASNLIQGNFIGTDVTGTAAVPNVGDGVGLNVGASSNTIGGSAAGAVNVISGNLDSGVVMQGSTTTGNSVDGNLIGTDATGSQPL